MSNKMLVAIIIVIILLGAGAAGYYYWQQTKPLKIAPADQTDQLSQAQTQTQPDTSSSTPDVSPTVAAAGSCQRDFDATKLAANANINIQNREVEITVAGFGKIDLEFYPGDAPKAVENFLRLTDAGYYDCLTFHRVAKGFVIQGGDPNGNGSGGQSAYGAPFADELNPNTPSYKTGYVAGILAMANSGPNTNGSQFFITSADDNAALTHSYTIFGHVVSGMDVVQAINNVSITPVSGPTDGSPTTPVVMTSVKIIK